MTILTKKNHFSDEAHFDLGEYVNKQNSGIWGTKNPHACHCLVRIFLENKQGVTITVNGDRYRTMLNEFLFTEIEEEDGCWQHLV